MTSQFADMTLSLNFFDVVLFKFSYWSKFHLNIMTGSGVMTIFFYKGLTRNREIGNTPVWLLPNIWRLGRVRDTKFGRNVSNEMSKCQGYRSYRFCKTTPHTHTQISVKLYTNKLTFFTSKTQSVAI